MAKKTCWTYRISRVGFTDSFTVNFYTTNKEMLAECNKLRVEYGKLTGKPQDPLYEDTLGAFLPSPHFLDDRGLFTSDNIGTMFLSLDTINLEIISHETDHAAFTHERSITRFNCDYGDGMGSNINEERFCYWQGSMTKEVYEAWQDTLKKIKKEVII